MTDVKVAAARDRRGADCDALRALVHARIGRGEKVSVAAVKKEWKG